MEIDLSTNLELNAELGAVGSMGADFGIGQVPSGIDTIKVNGVPLPVVEKSVNIDLLTPLSHKQDTLVSGANIKTVNGQSIVGAGNIDISGNVTSVNGKSGNVVLATSDLTNDSNFISSGGVDGKISDHNGSEYAHPDIRTAIGNVETLMATLYNGGGAQ